MPVIAAPMFLVSCPDLVVAACRAGVVGTFPALNQRDNGGYRAWLGEIAERLAQAAETDARTPAPFGVNLSLRRGNPRLADDLAATAEHRPPLVITSLGPAREVVDVVHSYGGLVFHDVTNMRHAEKAAEAGVDGLIAVSAGAGGHGGHLSPFAFLAELRQSFGGVIALSGGITDGHQVAAARLMGADLAVIGTRFIATVESAASQEQKAMVLSATAADIVYTPSMTGTPANFMAQSLREFGLDPANLDAGAIDRTTRTVRHGEREGKVWRDLWSAGHGVGTISDIPTISTLVDRLVAEFGQSLPAASFA